MAVTTSRVSLNAGNLLTSCEISCVSFPTDIPLYEVDGINSLVKVTKVI